MRLALACCLMLAQAVPASAQTSPDDAIVKLISDPKGLDAPGCVVGVFDKGKVKVYTGGAGDVATRRPLDGDTQIYSASVGKQFTALAVAQLAVAGKIGLDDEVHKWLPELPRYRAPVTIAMLVHHTSGIRDFLWLASYAGHEPPGTITRAQALAAVMRQRDTNFVPGTAYGYSNSGYLLLAEIVQRISGESFVDYVNKRIFKPMGMKRSFVLEDRETGDPNSAHGYIVAGDGYAVRDTHPLFGGASGIVFTANDLARYDRDINVTHRVWTPEVAKIMMMPGRLSDGSPVIVPGSTSVYAGAQMLFDGWAEHGGSAEGFKTSLARLPSRGITIATLCNRGDYSPLAKAQAVLDVLYPGLPRLERPYREPVAANGRFHSDELDATYELSTRRGRLGVKIAGPPGSLASRPPLELLKGVDGDYVSDNGGTRIVLDADGRGFLLDTTRASGIRFRRVD